MIWIKNENEYINEINRIMIQIGMNWNENMDIRLNWDKIPKGQFYKCMKQEMTRKFPIQQRDKKSQYFCHVLSGW